MASSNIKSVRLLDGATATSTGTFMPTQPYGGFHIVLISTGVTTGGSFSVDAQDFEDNTISNIATKNVTATGNASLLITGGPFKQLRANCKAYTDGTHTLRVDARYAAKT